MAVFSSSSHCFSFLSRSCLSISRSRLYTRYSGMNANLLRSTLGPAPSASPSPSSGGCSTFRDLREQWRILYPHSLERSPRYTRITRTPLPLLLFIPRPSIISEASSRIPFAPIHDTSRYRSYFSVETFSDRSSSPIERITRNCPTVSLSMNHNIAARSLTENILTRRKISCVH